MLILERAVTKPYKIALYDYICKKIKLRKYEYVNTEVIMIVSGTCSVCFAIVNNNKPVAWLYLARRHNWFAWEVKQAFVEYGCRKTGLGTKLYKAAINDANLLLTSGKTQTKSARALWEKFIKAKTFNIWAQDFKNLDTASAVNFENEEIFCCMNLYQKYPDKTDIRLLAIRKQ